jgi:hypothetical protein
MAVALPSIAGGLAGLEVSFDQFVSSDEKGERQL